MENKNEVKVGVTEDKKIDKAAVMAKAKAYGKKALGVFIVAAAGVLGYAIGAKKATPTETEGDYVYVPETTTYEEK